MRLFRQICVVYYNKGEDMYSPYAPAAQALAQSWAWVVARSAPPGDQHSETSDNGKDTMNRCSSKDSGQDTMSSTERFSAWRPTF